MLRDCSRSEPWVREVATSRASPALASHAEKASRIIGEGVKLTVSSWRAHKERVTYSDNIIPSKQRRAERRWVRWNARPVRPRKKAEEAAKCTGVIRLLWSLTTCF